MNKNDCIKKGLEAFIDKLTPEIKIKFDNLVIEYSQRYKTKNDDMIRTMAYNEVMRR